MFRYFYLIVFAMYIREVGPKEFPQTFKQWMEAKGDLEQMIAEGRGKLEWERKIPDEKLVELKELLDSKDFKANLSRVRVQLKDGLKCPSTFCNCYLNYSMLYISCFLGEG